MVSQVQALRPFGAAKAKRGGVSGPDSLKVQAQEKKRIKQANRQTSQVLVLCILKFAKIEEILVVVEVSHILALCILKIATRELEAGLEMTLPGLTHFENNESEVGKRSRSVNETSWPHAF